MYNAFTKYIAEEDLLQMQNDSLNTNNKTIIGAINELKNNVGGEASSVTSWNDLEDKPFYYNKKVLLNLTSDKTYYTSDTETIDLVVGEKYNVLFKDMLFRDMVCKDDGDGFRYLQDPNFFYIDDRGGAGLQISGGVYSSYTIEVYQEEIKKLDDLFLEQSDWNNNDEYSGVYIKNRPFYSVEPAYEAVSGEITTDVNTVWYGSNYYVKMTPGLGEKFRLSLQDVCTVIWDGVEYKDIQVQLFRTGRYPMTAIGNDCYETPLFTQYPFSIGYSSNNFNTELWICAREAGTHTFQIFLQTIKPELKQLDEKYIPDTIATKDFVLNTISELNGIILKSSTEGSSKKFRLIIDDDGILSAEEVVE